MTAVDLAEPALDIIGHRLGRPVAQCFRRETSHVVVSVLHGRRRTAVEYGRFARQATVTVVGIVADQAVGLGGLARR